MSEGELREAQERLAWATGVAIRILFFCLRKERIATVGNGLDHSVCAVRISGTVKTVPYHGLHKLLDVTEQ